MSNTPTPSQLDSKLELDTSNITATERMDLEIKILASYLRGPEMVKKQILATLQPAAYIYTGNIWRQIIKFVGEGILRPDLSTLLQDPNIENVERGMAEGSVHELPIETIEEAEIFTKRVYEQYHKDEMVASLHEIGTKLTGGSGYSSEEARMELQKKLEELAASMDEGGQIGIGLGYDSNSVVDVLTATQTATIIPTGLAGFDSKASGIAKGELHINACPSSGGKTTLMNQLCINMGLGMANREYVRNPMSVFYISLEMSQREMWSRIIANMSGIPISRFRKSDEITEEEKQLIADTVKTMSEHLANYGHMFRFENAEYGSIDAITRVLATHQFDVVIVDYLNLMADGENLWSSMGSIARSLKLLAQKRDFACITAAQLDEDSLKIRYSRMVKEHCDTIWLWQPGNGVRDANDEVVSAFTEIFVDKGRNIGKFSFWVHFDFEHMIVNSVNPATELGLTGPSSNAPMRLPGAGTPGTLALPNNTMGANTLATQIVGQAMEHSILTPPALNQVDAASGFGVKLPGSIPDQIINGANAFEVDNDMASYGDNAEGEVIRPSHVPGAGALTPPGPMTPRGGRPAATPLPSSPPEEVAQETTPWKEEPEPESVRAVEVDDNEIEL